MREADPTAHDVSSNGLRELSRVPRLFLHFFDIHFLEEKNVEAFRKQAFYEMRLAVRFGLLLADELLVPAASYFESDLCRRTLGEYDAEIFAAYFRLVGGNANLAEFIEDKHAQYRETQAQGLIYRSIGLAQPFPWRPRQRSATRDIVADWRQRIEQGKNEELFRGLSPHLPADYEKRFADLPEQLAGHAFIVENAVPLLFSTDVPRIVWTRLHAVVNEAYFRSYAQDFAAGIFRNMNFLESAQPLPSGDPGSDLDYAGLIKATSKHGVFSLICDSQPQHLFAIRDDERFVAAVSELPTISESGRARVAQLRLLPAAIAPPIVEQRLVARLVAAVAESSDFVSNVSVTFEILLQLIIRFLASRQDIGAFRQIVKWSYLFVPEKGKDLPMEWDLQEDLWTFLTSSAIGHCISIEKINVAGGRVDISAGFGDHRFIIEAKRELEDASPDNLRRYLPQTITYQSTDVRIGFLVVLDLTPKPSYVPHLDENAWVERTGPNRDRYVVVVRVPGNRKKPSEMITGR